MPPGLAAPIAGFAFAAPLFYIACVMLTDPDGFLSLVEALAHAVRALTSGRRPDIHAFSPSPGARAFIRIYGAVLALWGLVGAVALGLR